MSCILKCSRAYLLSLFAYALSLMKLFVNVPQNLKIQNGARHFTRILRAIETLVWPLSSSDLNPTSIYKSAVNKKFKRTQE